MRVFKSSLLYNDYVDGFYRERPGLADQSFDGQMATLLSDGFSFGDAWKHYLEQSDRYEVMEVVVNAHAAQASWAAEHGVSYRADRRSFDILQAQLQHFKPDVWFCHSWLTPEERLRLKAACPSLRFVVGYDGSLNHDPARLAGCDMVLTCVRESVAFYQRHGMRAYWMPWGFDPRIAERIPAVGERRGAVFCGSVGLSDGIHFNRVGLLDRVRPIEGMRLHLRGVNGALLERQFLSSLRRGHFAAGLRIVQRYGVLNRIRASSLGPRYGLAMYHLFAEAKIVLNLHGDAVRTAANMRMFEGTGMGSCLLTDWHDDLVESFEPDSEVVTFRSVEECAAKLRDLLEHDRWRTSIAAAGRARCLRDHRIGDRILGFAGEILDAL